MKLKEGENLISLQLSSFNFAEGADDEDDKTAKDEALIPEVSSKTYPSLMVITENGFGKQSFLGDYRKSNRAAKGVKTMNMTKKTGKPVIVQIMNGEESNLILTTKLGTTISMNPDDIKQLGRSTQGVIMMRLSEDTVISGGAN